MIAVGPDGDLVFDPVEMTVSPGATVRWGRESDRHSVTPDSRPEGADWRGTGLLLTIVRPPPTGTDRGMASVRRVHVVDR
ncbi:hypothetical protein BRC89_09960 [Halobacteriales archaeon QS_4_70_19]|nr:MAG: hypothetical protein BRC89_09960 [Halobacteriales archaeon QS_4_70_19]